MSQGREGNKTNKMKVIRRVITMGSWGLVLLRTSGSPDKQPSPEARAPGDLATMHASWPGSVTGLSAMAPETTTCMVHFTPGYSSWR